MLIKKLEWNYNLNWKHERYAYFDISMDDTMPMTKLKSLYDLLDAETGIFLTVELSGYNIIEQLTSSDPGEGEGWKGESPGGSGIKYTSACVMNVSKCI